MLDCSDIVLWLLIFIFNILLITKAPALTWPDVGFDSTGGVGSKLIKN